jgi:hypothetical protein
MLPHSSGFAFPYAPALQHLALCLPFVLLIAGCGPGDETPGTRPQKATGRFPELKELKVEIRADGLAYLPGSTSPFSGDAIELHYDRTPPRLHVRTPYRQGRIDGVKTTYSSGGKLREERAYKEGKPVSSIVYHGNGQKKIEVRLNDRDLAEGPYRRWHDNGILESEATFDADERFHGEEKDYDRSGKLVGHYRKEHGRLVEALFETPEMKAGRIEKWGPSLPGDLPAPAK